MAFFKNNAEQQPQSRESLEQRFHSARRSLLMVTIFTVINLVLLVTNSNSYFVFSAFIPYFLTGTGMALCGRFPVESYGEDFLTMQFLDPSFLTVMIAISVVIITLYLLAWYFSKNKKIGWLIFAFIFFALDTVVMFLLSDNLFSSILDILFHAWVLFDICMAMNAAGKLKKLPDEAELVPASDDSDPTAPIE